MEDFDFGVKNNGVLAGHVGAIVDKMWTQRRREIEEELEAFEIAIANAIDIAQSSVLGCEMFELAREEVGQHNALEIKVKA